MLRPSPNHGTQRLPNDDDDEHREKSTNYEQIILINQSALNHVRYHFSIHNSVEELISDFSFVIQGQASRCFQCIYLVAQSQPCFPMLLQPYNIWTLIVSNVFIWLHSHGHASRCYCSHILYGH